MHGKVSNLLKILVVYLTWKKLAPFPYQQNKKNSSCAIKYNDTELKTTDNSELN